jgi:hypothetical protein
VKPGAAEHLQRAGEQLVGLLGAVALHDRQQQVVEPHRQVVDLARRVVSSTRSCCEAV